MEMILLAAVVLIPIVFMLIGYHRGILKSLFSLVSLILALILVLFLHPIVNQMLRNVTPIYDTVKEVTGQIMTERLYDLSLTLPGDESSQAIEETDDAADHFSSKDIPLPGEVLTKEQQEQLMDLCRLPDVLWKEAGNQAEVTAEVFIESVSTVVADAVVNALSYVITFVVVFILIQVISLTLDIAGRLPVIHGANKLLGGAFGLLEGCIILGLGCLVITMIFPTEIGKDLMYAIQGNPILSMIYTFFISVSPVR